MPNFVPKILALGTLNQESKATNYFIMPKLDVSLTTYIQEYEGIERFQKLFLVFI